jgi:membrane-bound serine protease (ClpP class)
MNTRLIIAIGSSLFEEVLLVVAVLWLLPQYGIIIPLWILIAVMVLMLVNSVVFYIIGSRALSRKMLQGLPSMVGMCGETATVLAPGGTVSIKSELWQAEAIDGEIETRVVVRVVSQNGLRLRVCREHPGEVV